MAVCCPSEVVPFGGEPVTVIPYGATMQAKYGPTPRVDVWYYDVDTGEYYLSSAFFTRVEFGSSAITIDHGGPAVGRVVIH